ncbi:MAG: hypothetical protein ACE15D_09985 [Candidatus Eisenbacteria bacterium]|nr:hypothetical protein [Candidatus Eisenbacteria bacterium]
MTEDDLRIAELSVTRSVDRVQTEEQKQKLRTVRGLIDQARKAFDHEDLQAAANLAHKARLLADELGSALPPR